jgi:hypothetical protein
MSLPDFVRQSILSVYENGPTMIRSLDHIVHVVRNLDAAGSAYERMGFLVGSENRHPWGTRNRLIQLPGFYIELLAVPEPDRMSKPMQPQAFSFGAFNRDFLTHCGEGLSTLALSSTDPDGDKEEFDRAGFGGFDRLDFARKGRQPDGREVEVAFSLAFAHDPASKYAGFFSILHRTPENLWSAEMQRHPNGVNAIAAVVLVAENPTDHHIFLEAVIGARDIRATSLGLRIETPRGEVWVYDPRAFVDTFGFMPPPSHGMRFAAMIFRAPDISMVQKCFEDSDLPAIEGHGRLIVGPPTAAGAVVAFG